MDPWVFLKLTLATALAAVIIASVSARAPRRQLTWTDLRWLLLGATALYAVGLIALFKHFSQAAILLFAGGVATSALAAWLSRGSDRGGGPPPDDEPIDEPPPPGPDGLPAIDWAAFEREVRAYTERSRDLVSTR